MQPFANLRVVELTEALAGPYCAMLMGDLGADVVKIERAGTGDQSRRWGARLPGGESAYFCSTNRNKRSLTLNIQSEPGQRVLYRLLDRSDILLCNIPREDSLQRAGLDPALLRARFPRLIFASITGYGRSGPNAGRSGYDLVAQGEAGLMSVTGPEACIPIRYPIPIADMTTGLYTVIGVLSALRVRDQTGHGQNLDLSLFEAQAAYLTILAGDFFATGQPPRPAGNTHPGIVPYQVFHTADQDVVIAVGSEKQWAQFCAVLDLGPEVRDDPRFATNLARLQHRQTVVELLQDRLNQWPAAGVLDRLRAAEIPCGPINSVPETLADPHYRERGNVVTLEHDQVGPLRTLANPIRLSETPVTYRLPPPLLGQHTDEILAELGLPPSEVEALRAAGTV